MSSKAGLCCVLWTLAVTIGCSDENAVASTSPTRVSSGSGGTNRITLEAVVSDRSGACPTLTFTLGGVPIATTQNTDFDTPCDQVVNGAAVEVHGASMTNGTLVARQVGAEADARREPEFQAEGPVDQLSSANDCSNASGRGVNVLGLGFAIGSFTRTEEIRDSCENITVGTVIRVRGRLTNPPASPTPLRAMELEVED